MPEETLTCPKCSGTWQTKRRGDVVVERCSQCKGIFLDRGELERLLEAEAEYLANLPTGADADTTPHGRHGGVMSQLLGSETSDV